MEPGEESFVRIAVKIIKGNNKIQPVTAIKISKRRFIFFCQEGSKPLCTSINGTPITLFVCTAPLIISTASGVILMFTSLSLSCLKIVVNKFLSFFSTVITTSSILSLSIILLISLRLLYFFIVLGN